MTATACTSGTRDPSIDVAAGRAAAPRIQGWCPGALRPMASGDGLVVRVRARQGAVALDTLAALADIARRLGNGHIDVTRRANLQLRGITQETLPRVLDELASLGLLDASADAEAVRNIMGTPLAGLDATAADVRGLAGELERLLAEDTRLHALPGKFGYVVDGGGVLPVAGELADVIVRADAGAATAAIGIAGRDGWTWLGHVAASDAAGAARDAALAFQDARVPGPRGRMRDASAEQIARIRAALAPRLVSAPPVTREARATDAARIGEFVLAGGVVALGIGVPFGRAEAAGLAALVDALRAAGADEVRLSPWRVLYAGVRDRASARAVWEAARRAGFIVDPSDPMLRLEACPGQPDCPQALGETRALARRLAPLLPSSGVTGVIHVSGCAKGCARSAPAALTLVADGARILVVRDGTASDSPTTILTTAEIVAAPERALAACRGGTEEKSTSA